MKEVKTNKDIEQVAKEVIKAYAKKIRRIRKRNTNNSGRS